MNGLPHEHEFEPAPGLPEPLPADERLLWQGSPRAMSVARRVFHAGPVTVYLAAMLALRAGASIVSGEDARQALSTLAMLFTLSIVALGIVGLMAWLIARTTVYTITDKRVVMRIGIVLTITFNLPFRSIESAGLLVHAEGTGDIALRLSPSDRIAYLQLWPHARPWHVARPEPALRSIAEVATVAQVLHDAVAAGGGATVRQTSPTAPDATPMPEALASAGRTATANAA